MNENVDIKQWLWESIEAFHGTLSDAIRCEQCDDDIRHGILTTDSLHVMHAILAWLGGMGDMLVLELEDGSSWGQLYGCSVDHNAREMYAQVAWAGKGQSYDSWLRFSPELMVAYVDAEDPRQDFVAVKTSRNLFAIYPKGSAYVQDRFARDMLFEYSLR